LCSDEPNNQICQIDICACNYKFHASLFNSLTKVLRNNHCIYICILETQTKFQKLPPRSWSSKMRAHRDSLCDLPHAHPSGAPRKQTHAVGSRACCSEFFLKPAAGDAAAAENVASIYLFLSAALINQGGKQAAV
jgi:hypothetical protein